MELEFRDRLIVLRKSDPFRDWKSLDDERVCVLCERTFSGRDVMIDGDVLHCPTRNCPSRVHHWVYPGNPLISDAACADWWKSLGTVNEQLAV